MHTIPNNPAQVGPKVLANWYTLVILLVLIKAQILSYLTDVGCYRKEKEEIKKESSTKDYTKHQNKVIKNDIIVNKRQTKSQYTIKSHKLWHSLERGTIIKIKETTSLINLVIKRFIKIKN